MTDWARGATAIVDTQYVAHNGAPVDPTNPRVDILDPNGLLVVTDAVPERIGLGRFRHLFPIPLDALLGDWVAVFTGLIQGSEVAGADQFTVVPVGAVVGIPYGVTVEGVKPYVPDKRMDSTSKPSLAQVQQFLADLASRVAARVGPFDAYDDETTARLTLLAAHVVHLGAAAFVAGAGHPETARPTDASSYATWLWERHEQALAELVLLADELAPGEEPAGALPIDPYAGQPAAAFPAPMGWASRGF